MLFQCALGGGETEEAGEDDGGSGFYLGAAQETWVDPSSQKGPGFMCKSGGRCVRARVNPAFLPWVLVTGKS